MNEKGDRSCHISYQYTFHGDISTVQRNFKLHVYEFNHINEQCISNHDLKCLYTSLE